ncbi:hypothetical protein [Clostridium algidicarnis]|nr:hypothetical protein [Clostridium algidicarnis]
MKKSENKVYKNISKNYNKVLFYTGYFVKLFIRVAELGRSW